MNHLAKLLTKLQKTKRNDSSKSSARKRFGNRLGLERLEERALMAVDISISDWSMSEGTNLTPFTAANISILDTAVDLAYGPSRNGDAIADLYVIGRVSDNIVVYDGLTGAFVEQFATPATGLDGAAWLMFGPNGDLYVSTVTASGKRDAVLRIDQAKAVSTFIADSSLTGAKGMTFGPDGNFYLADVNTDRVARYNGVTGAFIDNFVSPGIGGLDSPGATIFGPDRNGDTISDLYVSSALTNAVLVYDGVNGSPLAPFVSASGGLIGPHDMEFGPDGNLYVVRSNNQFIVGDEQVYRFDGSTGAFLDIIIPPAGIAPETSFITFDGQGNLLISSERAHEILKYSAGPLVTLTQSTASAVTVDFSTSAGSATPTADYGAVTGRIKFAPGETSKRILVSAVDDTIYEGSETFSVNISNPVGASIVDSQGSGTIQDNDSATKFYVVNDGSPDRTYEYGASGTAIENYAIQSTNTSPRGAASTAAGDKVWVVDANKMVYVYNTSGGLLGSWSAGSLASNATVEGITTNGTDVWIVDGRSDKVFKYVGAATRTSGSQNAVSSFSLNGSNTSPTDLVTDGASIWVLNNTSSTDRVFKYSVGGSLLGSWTITSGGGSPTGLTIDPTVNNSHIWIVDNITDRVYQFDSATTRIGGSASPSSSFALAAGNTNPQGIADPPPPANMLASRGPGVASGKSMPEVEKPNRKILSSNNPFIAQVDSIFENWNEDNATSQSKKRLAGRR